MDIIESHPTFRKLVSNFADFLAVAIHTILYERQLYPRASFLSARRYNLSVRQNRHPKVCEWVNDAASAVENELLKCSVERIAVVVHDLDSKVLERYVFDMSRLPMVSLPDVDRPLERSERDGSDEENGEEEAPVLPVSDLGEQCRAALNQLAVSSGRLPALPKGCSFTVAMELKEEGQAPLGHPRPWAAAGPKERSTHTSQAAVKPVRAVEAGVMVFDTWIERASPASNEDALEMAQPDGAGV